MLQDKRQLLCDNHPPYCNNVEEDQGLENVLLLTLNNHYQRNVFSPRGEALRAQKQYPFRFDAKSLNP